LNHILIARAFVYNSDKSREAGRALGAKRPKPPEIEIYATNQADGK
jgi:hypothetical protein